MDGTAAGSGFILFPVVGADMTRQKSGLSRVQGWRFFRRIQAKKYYPSLDCSDRRSGLWGVQFPIYDPPYPVIEGSIRSRAEQRQNAQIHQRFYTIFYLCKALKAHKIIIFICKMTDNFCIKITAIF